MSGPRYPSGEEIHAGDRILFGGQPARIIFVTQRKEYAEGVLPSDWDFVRGDTIGVQFENGRIVMYDSFCHHDAITVLSRAGPLMTRRRRSRHALSIPRPETTPVRRTESP
jgi:hypothetical protein